MLICSHRLALYIPLIFIAFIAACILIFIYKKVKHSRIFSNYEVLNKLSYFIFPIAFLLLFFVQFSGIGFYNRWLSDFYSGYLFEGEETYIVILNILSDYFGKIGFLLLFGLIGFITLSRTAFNGFGRSFILLSVLTLTPFLVIEDYTPEIILVFFSILVGVGLLITYNFLKKRKRIAFSIIAICLVVSTGFSWFMLDHMHLHTSGMSDKTYATASFLSSDKTNGTFVANSGLLGAQISAFSGKACLPYGGGYAQSRSSLQLVHGSVKAEDVVTRLSLPSEIFGRKMFYEPISALPDAKEDWLGFMRNFPWAKKTKLLSSKYDIGYVIEDVQLPGEFWYWRRLYSRLLFKLHNSGNKIYDNGRENIWYLS